MGSMDLARGFFIVRPRSKGRKSRPKADRGSGIVGEEAASPPPAAAKGTGGAL